MVKEKFHDLEHESGQTIVLVALALVALIAFVGLALDGGYAFAQRRQMQNAADAAAMAGARELVLQGNQSAILNRINEYSVQRNKAGSFSATYWPGNQIVQASAPPPAEARGVCVISKIDYPTLFIRAVGFDTLHIEAQACAAADQAPCGGGYAIWADSPTCQNALQWSGSTNTVTGNVHSNNDIKVGGQTNIITGTCEYVTSIDAPPDKITYNPPPPDNPIKVEVSPLPVKYDIDAYRPGGSAASAADAQGKYHFINGDFQVSDQSVVLDGLYYVTGKVKLSGSNLSGTFTIVAEDEIDMSGSEHNVSPYSDGLLLFSNKQYGGGAQCNNPVIKMAGSTHIWQGIIYAPLGLIEMSGSSNTTINGSLIGYAVRLSGSTLNITFTGEFCSADSQVQSIRLRKP